jgi:serine/threonine protein kinase
MKANDLTEDERFHVGTTIAGRYRVERPIGEGAMGAVALARHESLDEKVAIKFLRPELRRDPLAIARLSREAKALARIKSDHVARVLDVGVTLAVGPYMVMEYLEGIDLGEVLEAEGPLPVARVVEIGLQVCEALTVAHTAGIIHRDIKPQNLFLARHGQFETLKILDFGIADDEHAALCNDSSATPASGRRAAAGPLYGTPSYMSPERVRNEPSADHRSDIWSVGVVLHELVTGRAVFDAPTVTETCLRVVSDAAIELEQDDSLLPPSLRAIIARCLTRAPEQRYQSVEELAAALAPLGSMTERFRGRSTGAFSLELVQQQLALSKTQRSQLEAASPLPRTPGDVPTLLTDSRFTLRRLARAVLLARANDRPLWQYAAVAVAGGLTVMLAGSLARQVRWMSPPITVHSEPLAPGEKHAVRGLDEPPAPAPSLQQASVDQRPALSGALTEDSARLASTTEPSEPSSVLLDAPPVLDATPARALDYSDPRTHERRKQRRKRGRGEPPPRPAEVQRGAATPSRMRLVAERPTRVRLVRDGRGTQRAAKRRAKVVSSAVPAKADAEAASGGPAPLPEWLELMRRGSSVP